MQCKILIKPYFSDKFDNIRYNVKYQLSFVLKLVSFYFARFFSSVQTKKMIFFLMNLMMLSVNRYFNFQVMTVLETPRH